MAIWDYSEAILSAYAYSIGEHDRYGNITRSYQSSGS